MRWAVAWVAAALGASGCAAGLRACPEKGGPPWRQVSSEHFALTTDLDSQAARKTVTDLEVFRAALIQSAWPGAKVRQEGRIPVYVLARSSDYHELYGEHVVGFFSEMIFQPVIVFSGESGWKAATVIKHEMVHFLAHFYVPQQPTWLSEGLATFLQTLEVNAGARELTVGRPDRAVVRALQTGGFVSSKEMFGWRGGNHDESLEYATAWLMTHYLLNAHPETFAFYQRLLQAVDDPAEAWPAGFPDLPPDQLDKQLGRHVNGGNYVVITQHFEPPAVATREVPLTDADVHATRALLHLAGGRLRVRTQEHALAAALSEVDEALRQDPNLVLAHAIRSQDPRRAGGPTEMRTLTQKNPSNWLAWLLLASALERTGEKRERNDALAKAVELAAPNPSIKLPFDVP